VTTKKASVIALAGRRIDPPGARLARFPLPAVDRVSSAVWEEIAASGAERYVSSAACGADLIGLQVAGQLGLRRTVVLPFDPARFRETSVIDRPGDWGPVFDSVLNSLEAGDLIVIGTPSQDRAYELANRAILDRAIELAGAPAGALAVIVWDGASRGRADVTEGFRAAANHLGVRITEVLTLATD
jgi:hypothetical protein